MNQRFVQQLFNRDFMYWITAFFLSVVLTCVSSAQAATTGRSDLNNDHAVDIVDLDIFSNQYLSQAMETVDWCSFYENSITNERYFRKYTSAKTERFKKLLNFIASSYNCQFIPPVVEKSDLNHDLLIDSADLSIFSTNYLETYWETVDWCLLHESTLSGLRFEGRNTKYYLEHFKLLLSFINNYYACGANEPLAQALQLESTPQLPTRIANAVNIGGDYYITDPMVGSLFIYDANLVLKAEIKGLNRPLGVAIDTQGYILIGNNGRDNIEVYDPANGDLLTVFGEGMVKMPTAITIDSLGNIYVTDSKSHNIQVFDAAYNPIRVIGKSGAQGALNFPVDAEIVVRSGSGVANIQEIFVADQGNKRLQVYDLDGNWLRNFTFAGTPGQDCNWMTGVCAIPGVPPLTRVQALDTDSQGRLHVLDNHAASVMIFDPADGAFLGSYGAYGIGAGFLKLPMDLLITETNMAIITSGDGDRIEVLTVP